MNKQYLKTDDYYLELSSESMILIQYRNWNGTVVEIDEYTFPYAWKVFLEKFKIVDLKPIGEHEFQNMYFLAKINQNQLSAA